MPKFKSEKLEAAVAVVIDQEQEKLLLIKRAERAGDPWSGHIAFPGGKRETKDPDLVTTAQRETLEEIGLDLASQARLAEKLPTIAPVRRISGMHISVTPFLFMLQSSTTVLLSTSDEVERFFWVDLRKFSDERYLSQYELRIDGRTVRFPAYSFDDDLIWGLTYRIIQDLKTWL